MPAALANQGGGGLHAVGKMKIDELFMVWLSLPDTRSALERIMSDISRGEPLASAIAGSPMDVDAPHDADAADPHSAQHQPNQQIQQPNQQIQQPHQPHPQPNQQPNQQQNQQAQAVQAARQEDAEAREQERQVVQERERERDEERERHGGEQLGEPQQQQHMMQDAGAGGSSPVLGSVIAEESPPHIQAMMHPRKAEVLSGGGPAPPRSPTGHGSPNGAPRSPSRVGSGLASPLGSSAGSAGAGSSSSSSSSSLVPGAGASTGAVPRFYWGPKGKPIGEAERAESLARAVVPFAAADAAANGLDVAGFTKVVRESCGLPSFFGGRLFERCGGVGGGRVTKAQFSQFWETNDFGRKDVSERLFELLLPAPGHPDPVAEAHEAERQARFGGAVRQRGKKNSLRRDYLVKSDFAWMLEEIVRTHPGLEFLEATPEFQEKYKETVAIRIFYTVNRSGSGRLTLRDMKSSDLAEVTCHLDEEPDINKVTRYYSYEAFYVLYCKHWEVDTDHDHLLDKDDLLRYGNYSLTFRVVDRIFGGYPRKLTASEPGKMSYEDFCWFLLSEEDKTTPQATAYWFRCMDLDGDGKIDTTEMRFFYQEQQHRMECISQEVVAFEDVLCQMTDLVKPETEGVFTLRDLRRSEEAEVFFNALGNLSKFIAYEQRDPFQMRADAQLGLTPWEKFVRVEYDAMAADEAEDEGGAWDEYDDGSGGGGAIEAPF